MNTLLITSFCVGFMVSEIPRVSVFGYFPLYNNYSYCNIIYMSIEYQYMYFLNYSCYVIL